MERMNYFSELWKTQREVLDSKQKDNIAIAYGEHVLGLSRETMEDIQGSGYFKVDKALKEPKGDYKSFWEEVENIVPEIYLETDIEFLSNDELAPVSLINNMAQAKTKASPIMAKLSQLFWVNK